MTKKLPLKMKQMLEYQLGKELGRELFNFINDMSAEIDRLDQNKVDVTRIHTEWPLGDGVVVGSPPTSGVWPINDPNIVSLGLHDHVGQDPLSQTDEVK